MCEDRFEDGFIGYTLCYEETQIMGVEGSKFIEIGLIDWIFGEGYKTRFYCGSTLRA